MKKTLAAITITLMLILGFGLSPADAGSSTPPAHINTPTECVNWAGLTIESDGYVGFPNPYSNWRMKKYARCVFRIDNDAGHTIYEDGSVIWPDGSAGCAPMAICND